MKKLKYILTKYETVKRVEKVEYKVEIPVGIKNKIEYANKKVLGNDYVGYKIIDICDSEILDDEVEGLKKLD